MDTFSKVLEDFGTHLMLFLPKLVVSLVVFTATLVVAGLLGRAVRRTMERHNADAELTLLMSKLARWAMIILGSVMALQQVNFDVTAFLTGLGILGFTIGFALQGISQNFVAGILLLLQQPFDIGDVIKVGAFSGKVATVDLHTTELHTFDGKTILIPNADVLTGAIVKYNHASHRYIKVVAGVSYDSDLDFVRQTTINAINDIVGVLKDPAPDVVFNNLGPSTIDFAAHYWIDTEQIGIAKAKDAGVRAIKTAFEQANIEMPYPTQTVYLRQQGDSIASQPNNSISVPTASPMARMQ